MSRTSSDENFHVLVVEENQILILLCNLEKHDIEFTFDLDFYIQTLKTVEVCWLNLYGQ